MNVSDFESTVAIIPARGGSKRIPRKNLRNVGGRPLIAHTILAARAAQLLKCIYVSTDDEEIASVAKDLGVEVIQRPSGLAEDNSSSEDVIRHSLELIMAAGNLPEHLCLLQPTSPFRTSRHIDDAITAYRRSKCRPLISVTNAPGNSNKLLEGNESGIRPVFGLREFSAKASIASKARYVPNGAIYLIRVSEFLESGCLYSDVMTPFIMSRDVSIDIDYPEDLHVAELIFSSIISN